MATGPRTTFPFAKHYRLEVHVVAGEPFGVDGEVAAGGGVVERAREDGGAVALQRHIVHHFVGNGLARGVEHVQNHVHVLLVAVKEEESGGGGGGALGRTDVHGIDEAVVVGGQSRGGVEALAAARQGYPQLAGIGRPAIGGNHLQLGDDPAERGAEAHLFGGGDVHRLGDRKGLQGVLARVGGQRRTGERERTPIHGGVADDHHRVAAHGETQVEVAKGGVGARIAFHLRHLVLFRAVRGVEGQRDGFDGAAVGNAAPCLRELFLTYGEIVHMDANLGYAFGFPASGQQQYGCHKG